MKTPNNKTTNNKPGRDTSLKSERREIENPTGTTREERDSTETKEKKDASQVNRNENTRSSKVAVTSDEIEDEYEDTDFEKDSDSEDSETNERTNRTSRNGETEKRQNRL